MLRRILPVLLGASLLLAAPTALAQQTPPPGWAAPLPRHRSTGMMITGIVFTSVGVVLGASGSVGLGAGCQNTACAEGGGFLLPAIILLSLGVAHVAVGIPLTVVGALPPKRAPATADLWSAPLPQAAAPRLLGLGWAF